MQANGLVSIRLGTSVMKELKVFAELSKTSKMELLAEQLRCSLLTTLV